MSTSNTGPFVKSSYTRGGITSRTELNTTGRMLSRIKFGHGIIGRAGPWGIEISATGTASFSGTAYAPNGERTTGLASDRSKGWIRWSQSDYAFTQQVGPPPAPWGTDEVWYEKANTAGNIVLHRLG